MKLIYLGKVYNFKLLATILLAIFILSCVTKQPHPSSEKKSILNETIRDMAFFPINGERFRLSELKDKKAIVIVQREKDCPIAEKYGPRLVRLEQTYSPKGIQFIYNYVGKVKIQESAKKDLDTFGFKAPYVMDVRYELINVLKAQTTGDIFILTPERRVIYKGPLDDQHHLLQSALKARNHYVEDILKDIIAGKSIIPRERPAPGCVLTRPALKKKVFFEDVAPIISKKCSNCHYPEGPAFINYVTYEDVAGRGDMFRHVIERDLMPPWNVDPATGPWANDISLTPKEKAMLLKWLDEGMPKKSEAKAISLWSKKPLLNKLGKPDYVIRIPEKVEIPAEGMNEYKYFIIPNPFKEDKWIKAVSFVTKPKVIHHILDVYCRF